MIPFLWVLPLALYLLSFIICFDSPRWYKRLPFGLALGVALAGICRVLFQQNQAIDGFVVALFVCCMVCHGELYRLKPDPRHLTGFYLMIAAGGALGGLFVAVIAPLIFTDYFELHWGLLMCGVLFLVVCLRDLRPAPSSAVSGSRLKVQGSWFKVRSWLRLAVCVLWAAGVVALGVTLWQRAHLFGEYKTKPDAELLRRADRLKARKSADAFP